MDEDKNTNRCPVCGGRLEFYIESATSLCDDCDYESEAVSFDDDDQDED